ncbi:MAG: hypothetical protein ACRDOU_29110 [Streptosporangiaceae bacterium]
MPAPAGPDPAEERDSKFAYGLDVVLDGLALRLRAARPGAGAPTRGGADE